ncbi:Nectin-2 [Merluccius polli]|uniref:Nectin-2 n=1 Tax=Merluccius polli TaxID=89951 RepID=A0AA47P104_MERPO|nr:Nectin-2 [Merluccius polli]
MPGNMSRAIFTLLLFGTALQGLDAVMVFQHETAEVAVGQNISLSCVFANTTDIKISQVEWRRNSTTKLVVHHWKMGPHYFSQDVYFDTEKNDDGKLIGSNLHFYHTRINDSGSYTCEFTTYPSGSISKVTQLKVKDVEVTCDKNGTLEVGVGENVTVHCELHLYPQAQYRWFKNETIVSETRSLEVRWMESHAGVYTLMVTIGNKTLQKSFNITIVTPTMRPSTAVADSTSQNTDNSSAGVYLPTTGSVEANFTASHLSNNRSQSTTANPYATDSHNDSFTVRPTTGSSTTTTLGLETHHRSTEKTGNVTEEHVPSDVYHQRTSLTTTESTQGGVTITSVNLPSSNLTTGVETAVTIEKAGTDTHMLVNLVGHVLVLTTENSRRGGGV